MTDDTSHYDDSTMKRQPQVAKREGRTAEGAELLVSARKARADRLSDNDTVVMAP